MRQIFRLAGAALLCTLVLAVGAQGADATIFRVSVCTYSKATAQQYNAFRNAWIRILYPDGNALAMSFGPVISELTAAANSGANKAAVIAHGKSALAHIPAIKNALDRVALDHDAMKRALKAGAFGGDKAAEAWADIALTALDGRLKQLFKVVEKMENSAKTYAAGNKEGGDSLREEALKEFAEAGNGYFAGVTRDITQAFQELADNCTKTVLVSAPMSPAQISNAAGGGGSQRASNGGLTVLAPKRLKLSKHDKQGRTTLPLTLTTSAWGDIEISLSRGKALIIDLHGTAGAAAHAKVGLRVVLPRKTRTGNGELTIKFTPSGELHASPIKLPVRLA